MDTQRGRKGLYVNLQFITSISFQHSELGSLLVILLTDIEGGRSGQSDSNQSFTIYIVHMYTVWVLGSIYLAFPYLMKCRVATAKVQQTMSLHYSAYTLIKIQSSLDTHTHILPLSYNSMSLCNVTNDKSSFSILLSLIMKDLSKLEVAESKCPFYNDSSSNKCYYAWLTRLSINNTLAANVRPDIDENCWRHFIRPWPFSTLRYNCIWCTKN